MAFLWNYLAGGSTPAINPLDQPMHPDDLPAVQDAQAELAKAEQALQDARFDAMLADQREIELGDAPDPGVEQKIVEAQVQVDKAADKLEDVIAVAESGGPAAEVPMMPDGGGACAGYVLIRTKDGRLVAKRRGVRGFAALPEGCSEANTATMRSCAAPKCRQDPRCADTATCIRAVASRRERRLRGTDPIEQRRRRSLSLRRRRQREAAAAAAK